MTILQAVLTGMLVLLAGTIPRNLLFVANLRFHPGVPWAVPLTAAYLWFFWQYLRGVEHSETAAQGRGAGLRAHRVDGRVWAWSLLAGGLGVVALVLALRVANRLVVLPPQQLPAFTQVPETTVLALLVFAAPVAGIVEEAAFRGFMQGPIERRHGLVVAILITGTMFALAHLDFTPILWPYYLAVAAIYGTVTHLTNSILPAVVLHTGGNLYSNLDLWMHGQAEWQASTGSTLLIWRTGVDSSFWWMSIGLLLTAAATAWAFSRLAFTTRAAIA
jgi:membrane protease YdiL (CAAX protease family)